MLQVIRYRTTLKIYGTHVHFKTKFLFEQNFSSVLSR